MNFTRKCIIILYQIMLLIGMIPYSGASQVSFYSQSGQDRFIFNTFFKNKREGTFVEIGANDGIKFSNTYFFEKHLGWQGICIEPMSGPFEELQKNRNCICVKGCITDMPGTKDFLLITGYSEMLSGLLEKYDPRHQRGLIRN